MMLMREYEYANTSASAVDGSTPYQRGNLSAYRLVDIYSTIFGHHLD
jgi:hypothetical protein